MLLVSANQSFLGCVCAKRKVALSLGDKFGGTVSFKVVQRIGKSILGLGSFYKKK